MTGEKIRSWAAKVTLGGVRDEESRARRVIYARVELGDVTLTLTPDGELEIVQGGRLDASGHGMHYDQKLVLQLKTE